METKYDSYSCNGVCEGCRRCLKGEKLVLFITGKCPRKCKYCSLSDKRKEVDIIWANETECSNVNEMIKEAEESNASSASITGGDPLSCLNRTIEYASALKKRFGDNFHIHLYTSLTLVNNNNVLERLNEVIDEIRFHPSFLSWDMPEDRLNEEVEKIKLAVGIFGKENVGCEMPMVPERKEELYGFIKRMNGVIGFFNLNEFELSDTNFNYVKENYNLNDDTYTIRGSKSAGKWIVDKAEKEGLEIKIHLCSARTKNWHQYLNRLKKHKILPFGKKTDEGTVIYYVVYCNDLTKVESVLGEGHVDEEKKRVIIPEELVDKAKEIEGWKVKKVEEYPTSDRDEIEVYPLN